MRFVRALLAAGLVLATLAPTAAHRGLEMTTSFPSVVADPGATVRFPIIVTTVLGAGRPHGDQPARRVETNFRGEGSTVAAITTRPNPDVAGEISGTFTAEISVPANVAAGSNQVVIEGRSASGTTTRTTRCDHRGAAARCGNVRGRLPEP